MSTQAARIADILRNGDDFLIVSHVNPDGDAIGSTAALGQLLDRLGKRYSLYNPSGLPTHLDFAPLPRPLETELPATPPSVVVFLDCGDGSRAGDGLLEKLNGARVVNIDHHKGNPRFGHVNWVEVDKSSVGEMVAEIAHALDIPLEGNLGQAVYLALVTDTGNFTYGNTAPETLELAAEIIRLGLEPGVFNSRITKQFTPGRLKLWSEALGGVRVLSDGRIGVLRITRDMFARTGTGVEDTDSLISPVRNIRGVEVALSLRENGDDLVKFSLRSAGGVDVQKIAAELGGGGHRNAAGGTVDADMDTAETRIVAAICKRMESDL